MKNLKVIRLQDEDLEQIIGGAGYASFSLRCAEPDFGQFVRRIYQTFCRRGRNDTVAY